MMEELENDDFSCGHERDKEKRRVSRMRQRNRERRRFIQLTEYAGYRPSIWARGDWNDDRTDYVFNGRIRRGKHSRHQQWMKKQSEHLIRNLPFEEVSRNGRRYHKWFDYWWTWY